VPGLLRCTEELFDAGGIWTSDRIEPIGHPRCARECGWGRAAEQEWGSWLLHWLGVEDLSRDFVELAMEFDWVGPPEGVKGLDHPGYVRAPLGDRYVAGCKFFFRIMSSLSP